MLESLGSTLDKKYRDYLSARYDKDIEWERAIKQYEGEWDSQDLEKIQIALSATDMDANDPISVNITRPKTNIAISRMKDIQFPTGGDFNFNITPAPLTLEQKTALETQEPDGAMQMMGAQQGVPLNELPSPANMAQEVVAHNVDAAPKMERALRNRMIYCDYGKKARLSIEDLCIKGCSVIKGPTIQNRKQKKYSTVQGSSGPQQVLNESFVPEPSIERIDPIFFFPDPSARYPDEIEDCFELRPHSATELIELAKNPAYMKDQIRLVLEDKPSHTDVPDIVARIQLDESTGQVHNRYWLREYHGPLDKAILHDAGMISEEEFEDNLKQFRGEVWFTNNTIIRMSLSNIEGEDSLPYGVACWEPDPNSVLGHGVPFLLRDAQRTVNNAYLMLLDNASLTSGPQIVLNKSMIEPAQGNSYAIEPMKVWWLTEYGVDVREAMQFINIPAQMEGIQQIIDTAMQFADVESSTPLLQQGDMPVGNNTTTGLAMVMSATNIIQKAASMNWDDYITKPLVHRFYHYEMQYGEDASIKGDFEINVGGATERIESQAKAQEIERMLGLAGSNPEFQMQVDANKAFRALVDNTRTGDLLRSPEEVEQMVAEQQQAAAQQQESDPAALTAQAALITAQAKQAEIAARQQKDGATLQLEQMKLQVEFETARQDASQKDAEMQMKYQIAMIEGAQARELSIMDFQKEMQTAGLEQETKLQLAEMDFAKFNKEIEMKEIHGTGI
jgi:hypothetical protein